MGGRHRRRKGGWQRELKGVFKATQAASKRCLGVLLAQAASKGCLGVLLAQAASKVCLGGVLAASKGGA